MMRNFILVKIAVQNFHQRKLGFIAKYANLIWIKQETCQNYSNDKTIINRTGYLHNMSSFMKISITVVAISFIIVFVTILHTSIIS